jgi:hypothetical protein
MACLNPLQGYHQIGGGLTFKKSSSNGSTLTVNCGQCLGCRMARSKEWAIRIMHEAKMHPENCFLTLTYEDAPHSLNSTVGNMDKFIQTLATLPQTLLNIMHIQKKTQSDAHIITRSSSITTSTINKPINRTIMSKPYLPPLLSKNYGDMVLRQLETSHKNQPHTLRATSLKRLQAISAIRTILKSTNTENYMK